MTADHGESLGDHGEQSHGLFIYESTLHVPWVMAGPGIPAGVRVEEPVSLVHVMPTILDLVDVAGPPGLDGASTRALWDGVGGEAYEAASAPVTCRPGDSGSRMGSTSAPASSSVVITTVTGRLR